MIYLRKYSELRKLSELDTRQNYHEIVRYLANHDAPLDYLIAGELAQIQTFGIPSISKILRRTRQYQDHGLKRLDDTRAILTETLKDSVHSERGQHMVEHLNWIHSHYPITNEDYLYTLALFVFEPARWMDSFGYRKLEAFEKEAAYLEFRDLGRAMKIKNIPDTAEEFYLWYMNYRRSNMVYHPDNTVVTQGLIDGMKMMFPSFLRPLVRPLILTLMNDSELLNAVGMKAPPVWQQKLIRGVMKVRAGLMKIFNPWQQKAFEDSYISRTYHSYPGGYQQYRLGPDKLLKNQGAAVGCPFHSLPVAEENSVIEISGKESAAAPENG